MLVNKINFIVWMLCLLSFSGLKAKNVIITNYEKNGAEVTFRCQDSSAFQIFMCSNSMVRFWYDQSGKMERRSPSYAVVEDALEKMEHITVNEQAACYEIFTPKLRLRINKSPLSIQIFDKYQKLLYSDCADKARVYEGKRKSEYKTMRRDENFFGLGEKAGPMNRRGENYKMWNSDKPCYGVTEDPLYKSIPFFMSNYRYGIFLDNTYKTEFKFGTESRDYYSFEAPDGDMIYYFIHGKDYNEILSQYISLTGQPIMPPNWAFGFSICRGLLTNENLTRSIADGFRSRNIPLDIIYQDIGWTNHLQDFNWREGNYENPKKMLADLKADGFKVIVSQDPVISQANKLQWQEAHQKGYFVKDSTTDISYNMPWPWGGDCGVVDFTIPEVADWWGTYQQKPIDDGIAGFWTDMGEPAWSNEDQTERLVMKHHAGMHDEIHNVYGLTWDKVVKEQFEKRNPDRRVFQMTRAAYAGLQKYTFGWTGDSGNGDDILQGWNQLANQIPLTLSAGLGGIPFITCDITGYCGDIHDYKATSELFIRWMQYGVFNPLSRLHHEGNVAVEPWLFGEEAEKIAKEAIALKYKLHPYLYSYAREAYEKGLPIMKPLFLEYPNDAEAVKTDEQFLFGRELLIAPVVKKGSRKKNVYLPEGRWIDYNNKKTVYEGEQWISVDAPLACIPMFVKVGSIIPTMPVMQYVDQQQDYPITFEVFQPEEEQNCSFTLYEDEGENLGYQRGEYMKTIISCINTTDRCLINVDITGKGYEDRPLRRNFMKVFGNKLPKKILIDGNKIDKMSESKMKKSAQSNQVNSGWCYDKELSECVIKLPATDKNYSITIEY